MDHRVNHPRQHSDRNVSPEALDMVFAGLSDPEEDDISDVQSFDKDDMWSDNGNGFSDHIPESEDDSELPTDDIILTLLESVDDVWESLVGIVCLASFPIISDC